MSGDGEGAVPLWSDQTWIGAKNLLDAGAVAILPTGAIEPHGPHLPLSTDVIIAEEMARRGAVLLAARGITALVLPPVVYSVAEWASGFAGRISLAPDTARGLVRDVCLSALAAGARRVAIANAHLEPANVACLREACREVEAASGVAPVFPDVTRRRVAGQLGAAFMSGDHAGAYETSLLMAARPDLVREEARRGLAAMEGSLVEKILAGATSFVEAGMEQAYCGDPASATAAEGERLFGVLAGILESAVVVSLGADRPGGV